MQVSKKATRSLKLNGNPIYTGAELVGQIATFSPGDKITVTYKRDGQEFNVPIQLRNNSGTMTRW